MSNLARYLDPRKTSDAELDFLLLEWEGLKSEVHALTQFIEEALITRLMVVGKGQSEEEFKKKIYHVYVRLVGVAYQCERAAKQSGMAFDCEDITEHRETETEFDWKLLTEKPYGLCDVLMFEDNWRLEKRRAEVERYQKILTRLIEAWNFGVSDLASLSALPGAIMQKQRATYLDE